MPHLRVLAVFFFFFNDTATTEIYTLSLHDALPISIEDPDYYTKAWTVPLNIKWRDRKSTRLNSSHLGISYAVFCLKKKKKKPTLRGNTMWSSRRVVHGARQVHR